MKCLYIGIAFFAYNYMVIFGQILSDNEETSYIGIDNGTRITECIPASSTDSYEKHRCPENMTLYPIKHKMDVWMCECKPGFLYFPLDDSCYKAYRQGPCPFKNYLILPENETTPRCVENPCLEDGVVPYNGTCYPLKAKHGPCESFETLKVDKTTFQLKCMRIRSHFLFIDNFASKYCPSGSRRSLKSGVCRKISAHYN